MRTTAFTFIILSMTSCTNNKEHLAQTFEAFYNHIKALEYDKAIAYLEPPSIALIDKISTAQNIDEMMAIGQEHNIRYFCAAFYANHNHLVGDKPSQADFLSYLSMAQMSIFELQFHFEPYKDKTKMGPESYLALLYDYFGDNKLGWAKFIKNEQGEFRYDLLYSMQLHESFYKEIYNDMRLSSGTKDYEASFKYMYENLPRKKRNSEKELRLFRSQLAPKTME